MFRKYPNLAATLGTLFIAFSFVLPANAQPNRTFRIEKADDIRAGAKTNFKITSLDLSGNVLVVPTEKVQVRLTQSGKDPEVKAWAGKTLPTLEEHLKMVEDLNRTAVGTSGVKKP